MTFNFLIEKKNIQSRLVLLIIFASLIPTSITTKGSDSRALTQYFLANVKPNELVVIDKLALPDFLYYTYNVKMKNKIIVPFDKKDGKIMYKRGALYEFPNYDEFWFYATKTKGLDKYVIKEGKYETIEGYRIIEKMVTPNGVVIKVSKD